MAITFGDNQYGKAEVRLVRITRDGERHQIKDLNVSTALRGDFADAHLLVDNDKVVATVTQKNTVYADVRRILIESFAAKHSLALQQTLYYMGEQVLEAHPEVAEIRMSMPNKHHFLVDLSPFGLPNDNQVYYAADRPYGLIEGTVTRDDAPDPGRAWQELSSLVSVIHAQEADGGGGRSAGGGAPTGGQRPDSPARRGRRSRHAARVAARPRADGVQGGLRRGRVRRLRGPGRPRGRARGWAREWAREWAGPDPLGRDQRLPGAGRGVRPAGGRDRRGPG